MILWLLLLLLALIALALLSWLRLGVALSERGGVLWVRWLGLGVRLDMLKREFSLSWLGLRVLRKPLRTRSKKPLKPKSKEPTSLKSLLAQRPQMLQMARYLYRHTHLEQLELEATLATPDPALTGVGYGLIEAVQPLVHSLWPGARIRIRPDFLAEWPTGHFELALRILPLHLVVLGWRGFVLMRRVRNPRKQERKIYGTQRSLDQHGGRNAPGRQDRDRDRRPHRSGG